MKYLYLTHGVYLIYKTSSYQLNKPEGFDSAPSSHPIAYYHPHGLYKYAKEVGEVQFYDLVTDTNTRLYYVKSDNTKEVGMIELTGPASKLANILQL